MNAIHDAREILEIMLRHLGYSAEVAIDDGCEVPGLQVTVPDAKEAVAFAAGELKKAFARKGGSAQAQVLLGVVAQ